MRILRVDNKAGVNQPIIIVQGGQYGSEAKGAITGYICQKENVDIAVRTGAVNAGHTVMYAGRAFKMQQLPVAWVNPNTLLVIGAGALIHPEILARECEMIAEATGEDIRDRLVIDYNAGTHGQEHTDRSAASGRHHGIGATGKGSSEAIIDKLRGRDPFGPYKIFGRTDTAKKFRVTNTAVLLNDEYDGGKKILLEGTQGTLLDLHTGPYPYVTHKSVLAAAWMAECGLSPALPTDIVMVVRTYPIRVAGNSGHMPDEISWIQLAGEINAKLDAAGQSPIVHPFSIAEFEQALAAVSAEFKYRDIPMPSESDGRDQHKWLFRSNYKEALSELNAAALKLLPADTVTDLCKLFELTTVTRKMRRISRLSSPELHYASQLTRPHRIALTFMNYEFPQHWFRATRPNLGIPETQYIQMVESVTRAPVDMISYGPGPEHVFKR